MLTLLVLARLTQWPAIRWGGLKEITFLGRPYKDAKIKVVYTTFISLPYTMTPSKTISFQMVNPFPKFFLFFKLTFGRPNNN